MGKLDAGSLGDVLQLGNLTVFALDGLRAGGRGNALGDTLSVEPLGREQAERNENRRSTSLGPMERVSIAGVE